MNNLLHYKYAVEVEKEGSISKAAENLYMGQPHLSKAIRDLEDSLGIAIFNRTSKGVIPTESGAKFLIYAKNILSQVDAIESLYSPNNTDKQRFDLSSPRASYVAHAVCKFANTLDPKKQINVNYRETNSADSIQYVSQSVHNLAVIRYQVIYEQYFLNALAERNLKSELLWEFDHVAIFSKDDPLAQQETVEPDDLRDHIEILHSDISVPSLPTVQARKIARDQESRKTISVYERGSQFQLLSTLPKSFIWVSPEPKELLEMHNLVQRYPKVSKDPCKDLLIWRKSYHLSKEDKRFIKILKETISEMKK